jgi:hypothetical protein
MTRTAAQAADNWGVPLLAIFWIKNTFKLFLIFRVVYIWGERTCTVNLQRYLKKSMELTLQQKYD